MMLISIVVLKFESTVKIIRFEYVIILKTMKTPNCQFLGNQLSIKTGFDADFNGPHSSFRLKARLWEQSYKDLKNFCVTTDMIVGIDRQALYVKGNLNTKFCCYRT